jgi:hypothetical protein
MTAHERAIREVCGPLSSLAYVALTEGLSLQATTRIATLVRFLLDEQARHAGRTAADVLAMERLAPGSLTDDDPTTH